MQHGDDGDPDADAYWRQVLQSRPQWDDRALAADAYWDSEGHRTWDPRGRPQGTVDRILQLGQTSV